jgi:hypothetical protein
MAGDTGKRDGEMPGGLKLRTIQDWLAVPVLLVAAMMLIADIGATGLWIAVIAVEVVLVAMTLRKSRQPERLDGSGPTRLAGPEAGRVYGGPLPLPTLRHKPIHKSHAAMGIHDF